MDRMTSGDLRKYVGVEPITTVIRGGRLRWYGHMMRKSDEDWVKFFGEASLASPQHGWRSAYSLRGSLSPIQDQKQH